VKRRTGCGSWVLAIVALAALTFGMSYVAEQIDRRRFPWGYADSGQPALVGTWVGALTSGSGQRLGMLLDMELAPLDRGRRHPPIIRTSRSRWLEGRVLVCAAPGRVQHFTAWGEPADGAASHFRLSLSPADSVPLDGLAPSHIRGRWDGRDSLALEASLYLRRGKSAISSSDDPDTKGDTPLTMKRGTEAAFDSLCSRLRA
jgi:hypothetical protein